MSDLKFVSQLVQMKQSHTSYNSISHNGFSSSQFVPSRLSYVSLELICSSFKHIRQLCMKTQERIRYTVLMESTYCLWSYGHSTRFGCLISTICKEEEKTLKILNPQIVLQQRNFVGLYRCQHIFSRRSA